MYHSEELNDSLNGAIAAITMPSLKTLAKQLSIANQHLAWRVDNGLFYSESADVGQGYLKGNLHSELIGPDGCIFVDDYFRLGFFLLAPFTLYRDHAHSAPELYVTLTGPSGWRFSQNQWIDKAAGEILWNPSDIVHGEYSDTWCGTVFC